MGASGGAPGVAPGAQYASSHRWGTCFGNVDGFFQLVVEDRPARRGFIGVGKESADSGANGASEVVGEGTSAEPLGDGGLGGLGFFGGALEYRAPRVVWD